MLIAFRWKYMQTFVMDGNFSAEHLKMRRPTDDIPIADGHAFMVQAAPYAAHLKEASKAAGKREVSRPSG